MITAFTQEVIDQLQYYVYRLIDPRDGNTFYVGMGQGNRVFDHMRCALSLQNGQDTSSLKYSLIRDIENAGLKVLHVIQKWNLTKKEAEAVEAALIDVFSLEKLSNLKNGKNHLYGPENAEALQRKLSCKEFAEDDKTPPFLIIKVSRLSLAEADRYTCTRSAWKVDINKARKTPYVLSVTDGIVYAVYQAERWNNVAPGRYEFFGKEAPDEIARLFLNRRIPEKYRKKGLANPVLYSKR